LKRLETKHKNITNLWLDFWENSNELNKYPIRLNPEIKISFIEKNEKFIEKNS